MNEKLKDLLKQREELDERIELVKNETYPQEAIKEINELRKENEELRRRVERRHDSRIPYRWPQPHWPYTWPSHWVPPVWPGPYGPCKWEKE